jgi:hypothetical protein
MKSACCLLHERLAALPRHRFPFDAASLPRNGIYVLFERGETAHGTDRIVRVGTHTGEGQLPSRLQQHFLNENKDQSIFRKNIGRALLKDDPFLAVWEIDRTTRAARDAHPEIDRAKQAAVEAEVTAYMREVFSFCVIPVESAAERLELEARLIGTVAACTDCAPSADWLGHSSPKDKIRSSGLWLVNGLTAPPFTLAEALETCASFS